MIKALLSCAAVVAILAGSALAVTTAYRTIGRASSSGDYAIALASAQAKRPSQLLVRVLASPNQRISVNWTMVCSKGFGAGTKSGQFAGTTPILRALRFPMARPDDCTVSSTAQLKAGGRVTVILLKRVS